MKVFVVTVDALGGAAEVICAEPGHPDFCRRWQLEALFDDSLTAPCLGDLDDEILTPIGSTSPAMAELAAKGAPAIKVTGDDGVTLHVDLATLRPGLTRSKAGPLVGPCHMAREDGGGTWPVWDFGANSLDAELELDAKRKAAKHIHERGQRGDVFVNPYTFVPFPASEPPRFREEPAGHDRLRPGHWSGSIEVELVTTTPLLTRGEGGHLPRGADGRPILPGSSLKGAIRSLYETLAGGCLRVFDDEFVPVYRDVAKVDAGLKMAVVEEVDHGVPLSFRLCDEYAWVPAHELHGAIPASDLRTGARVTVGRVDPAARRYGHDITNGGDWVVLITAAEARAQRPTRNNPDPTYYAAVGRLGTSESCLVDLAVWERYLRVVDGGEDERVSRQGQDPNTKVVYRGQPIGHREAALREFQGGEVVWVKLGPAGRIAEIKRSYLWRSEGQGESGSRVPAWLRPCGSARADAPDETGAVGEDADHLPALCPACRLFGAAEEVVTGATTEARQRSYRGHVRFIDAVATGDAPIRSVDLAPLGGPRPGAGQFYLAMNPDRRAAKKEDRPAREWGAMETPMRPLRGRKYYWTADPARQAWHRDRRGPGQTNAHMGGQTEVLAAGTRLTTRITFENLSSAEVGGLLATLKPGVALAAVTPPGFRSEQPLLRLRVGGGKPLGYGAVEATITSFTAWTAASRYLGEPAERPDDGEFVAAFIATVPEEVRSTWPSLAAVLAEDHVNPERVAYPPALPWGEADAPEPAGFRNPFPFFKATSGQYRKDVDEPLQLLPDPPSAADQYLPIVKDK